MSPQPVQFEPKNIDIQQRQQRLLIIQQHRKKWIAHCANQAKSIQSLCEKNIQPKIIHLEGIVLKRSLMNYKNTPQDMFIRKIQFTEHLPEQEIITYAADAKDFAAWQKTVYMPLYFLRMLCLINLIWLGSLPLRRPLNSSSA